MTRIEQKKLTGERALFQAQDMEIVDCTFADGESPLKESRNLKIQGSMFQWKYPLWYSKDIEMQDCTLFDTGRAGIWYTSHLHMQDTAIQAPKTFRRCDDLKLERVDMPHAEETLWNCNHIVMKDVTATGPYFGMNSSHIEIDGFTLVGDYSFDGCSDITIRNAKMLSKDAFWNCEHVTVYDSFIAGQYFGWNAKDVTLINCTISSEQGMCYMDHIVMKNCKVLDTDLAFEYSTVDAEIISQIDSIKNPISGRIQARGVGEILFDNPEMQPQDTQIVDMDGHNLI